MAKKTKRSPSSPKAGGKLKSLAKTAKGVMGGKSGSSGNRRRHGVNYWANKVLVERLKKKYHRIKFGSVR